MQMNIMMYKVYYDDVAEYLTELFCLTSKVPYYNLRGSRLDMQLPKPKTNSLKRSFAAAWNVLPNHVRDLKTLNSFKAFLRRDYHDN